MRILQDYPTRYEHLLAENRSLHSKSIGTDSNDGDNTHHANAQSCDIPETIHAMRILSNHAAMEGMLQTTIKAAKLSTHPSFNGDGIESIQYLLEETSFCNDYGLDAAGCPLTRGGIGEAITRAAVEQEELEWRKRESSDKEVPSNVNRTESDGFDSENEVDAFFEDFPECAVNEWNYFQVEHEDSDHENDVGIGTSNSSNTNSKLSNRNHNNGVGQHPLHAANSSSRIVNAQGNSNHYNQAIHPQKPIQNPYAKPRYGHTNHNQNQSHSAQSWDAYHARNEDPTQQHLVVPQNDKSKDNPFRTAREYKLSNNDEGGEDNAVNYRGGWGDQMDSNGFCPDNKNLHNLNQSNNQNQPYNPHRPSLSAGLKRKFQNPKHRTGNDGNVSNNNSDNGRSNATNAYSSRGNREDQSGSGSKNSSNNNSNGKEDDSDLPEELKGLDKELIAKIENEIVDSGDPITFKDIAGLHDAKQTVMELVCWPMKRPDLFTGLRRGPNGLLL